MAEPRTPREWKAALLERPKATSGALAAAEDVATLFDQLFETIGIGPASPEKRQKLVANIGPLISANTRDFMLRSVLKQIMEELPARRDWLDPDLETMARVALEMTA